MSLVHANFDDESVKIEAYANALKQMWLDTPNRETQRRYEGFISQARGSRILWIRWVESQVENIDWCRQLAVTAVTCALEGR